MLIINTKINLMTKAAKIKVNFSFKDRGEGCNSVVEGLPNMSEFLPGFDLEDQGKITKGQRGNTHQNHN
jgi:hypothetical protein